MKKLENLDTKKLVLLALFTAIVILLQLLGSFIKLGPFSISLVLMPIAVGAALIGSLAGAWLGLVFGFVVLASGDANLFLAINPAATIAVVLLKGVLAGFIAGLIYKLISGISKIVASVATAIACPIINTGVFVIGCYAFFLPDLTQWGEAFGSPSVTAYIFLGMIGINFLIEAGVNLVLSPTIVRLIQIWQDRKSD